ncbi:HAMP domain-containing sensor histidine kinase [Streptomyces sp. ODS28]|uniref:sensor histidine kinase n=1 Tax=Streptomyces sp. ODS28 TaxID=3136688 RepID=UPI0031ED1759
MKLSTRIALAAGLGVPLLVLACGWLIQLLVAQDLHDGQDAHLRERARSVSQDARRLLRVTADGKPVAAQRREREMFGAALDVGVRVQGPYGAVSGGPQPDERVRLPRTAPQPVTVREKGTDEGTQGNGGGEEGKSWRVLSRPLNGPHPGVHGRLWLFLPDSAGREQIASVRGRVLGVALAAAPVSALLAWAAASRAGRPLRSLQRRAGGLDPHRGSARLTHTPTGISEVDDLAATLTTVLARYDEQVARTGEALETARTFASAAGHELRTPMMSMRTNLDILAEHPDLDPEELREVAEELRHEHERMLGLLVMLRELGRGELVEDGALSDVDLAEVAEAAVADARRRAPGASLTIEAAPGRAVVHGWEPGLRTLLDNLLANSLAHGRSPGGGGSDTGSPDGGASGGGEARVRVSLSAGEDPECLVLRVDDEGPGIPADLRPRVLERFRRGPGSSGSGLGLTLVAQQAALHGAELRIGDGPGGRGTRVELRFAVRGAAHKEITKTLSTFR